MVTSIRVNTLYLCVATWEGNDVSLSANILRGIARLLYCYGDSLQMDVFIDRLGRISAKEITRMAKERRNGSLGYAETMLQIYNKRAKHRLDYSNLYDSRTKRYMQLLDESEASEESAVVPAAEETPVSADEAFEATPVQTSTSSQSGSAGTTQPKSQAPAATAVQDSTIAADTEFDLTMLVASAPVYLENVLQVDDSVTDALVEEELGSEEEVVSGSLDEEDPSGDGSITDSDLVEQENDFAAAEDAPVVDEIVAADAAGSQSSGTVVAGDDRVSVLQQLINAKLLEVTPQNLRIRKRILDHSQRMKSTHGGR